LAQVDASIGGKTAIDFGGIKNLIGTFYQPKTVLIDPLLLMSLNNRQYTSGLAEIIKYGIIQDAVLFKKIEDKTKNVINRDPEILNFIIRRSCELKARIVSEDEKEKGKRSWLNYGHTLGHALESYFKYKILTHGEAIAYGMYFAAKLSQRLNICTDEVPRRQNELLRKVGLFRKLPRFDIRTIYKKMILDKKGNNGKVQFILTRKIGLVTIQKNIPKSIILSALKQFQTDANGLY
jgi:3-dehydroquinate synthase